MSKTVFTANHLTEQNRTEQKNTQTKYNSEKRTTQNTAKQNYAGSVARPSDEIGLFYNTPNPTEGQRTRDEQEINAIKQLTV